MVLKRVALYIRVSTQEQAMHGLSLPAQEATLRRYAQNHKYKVVDLYADEGISARKPASKRPSLQRLLDDVRQGKIDLILFIKLDRWFRNVGEYYKVQDVLDANHVDWACTEEDYDTSTAAGRLKINIMLSVAQDEADRTSERIKFVFENKRQSGKAVSGKCPVGYTLSEDKAVIKNGDAPLVDKLFQTYLETSSIAETIRRVPELSLNHRKLSRILNNTAYYGDWNGTPTPPYISRETYDTIHGMRSHNGRKAAVKTHIFSGLIACGECKRKYSAHAYRNKSGLQSFYMCHAHYNFGGCGNNITLAEKTIEQHLLDSFEGSARVQIEAARAKEVISHEPERARIKAKLAKLSDLYINDLIDMGDYKRKHDELMKRYEEIKEDAPAPNIGDLEAFIAGGWKEVYEKLDSDGKRAFWLMRISEIRIYNDRRIEFDLRL